VATAMAGGVLAAALLLRMVADTAPGLGWLRWATPLGWAEEMRAFTGARPLVLVLPVVATTVLLIAAARIAERRDIGTGLLAARDTAAPRLALLSSPTALALRTVRGGLIAWLVGVAAFAVILGGIADSVASGLSESLQEQFEKFGTAANTATSFLGLEFLFVVFALSLFVCFQLGAVREDEAEQRLETLLVLPLSRARWLSGRLARVAGAVAVLALAAGVLSWAGAVSQGADVSFARMLEATANCLPAALLFLALGALALALAPRAGVAIAYVLVGGSFMWEAIGGLVGMPGWLLAISPFHHVAPVPAESLQVPAAVAMLALAAVAAAAALRVFERRDLAGA
jgi:ABC-2 type transport system permease protein